MQYKAKEADPKGSVSCLFVEFQHIIRAQHLFLFDFQAGSGDAGVGVIVNSQMISFE